MQKFVPPAPDLETIFFFYKNKTIDEGNSRALFVQFASCDNEGTYVKPRNVLEMKRSILL